MNKLLFLLIMLNVFSQWNNTDNYSTKCKMYHKYLQNNIKGIVQIKDYYDLDNYPTVDRTSSIYIQFCNSLELTKPEIRIMGWEKMHSGNILIELYAEDLSHLGIFLLVIDTDCNIRDFLYLDEPINGDQIEYKDNFSIEWHYKANFKFHKDTIIAHHQSIDIKYKYGEEKVDTLYKKHISSRYIFDLDKGFCKIDTDSIMEGIPYL